MRSIFDRNPPSAYCVSSIGSRLASIMPIAACEGEDQLPCPHASACERPAVTEYTEYVRIRLRLVLYGLIFRSCSMPTEVERDDSHSIPAPRATFEPNGRAGNARFWGILLAGHYRPPVFACF
jgi:hypothetical protein